MARLEKTSKRDILPYLVHRVLGSRLYATDIDTAVIAKGEEVNGVFAEMNDDLDFVALIDYKHPTGESHQNIDLSTMAVRAQSRHATKNGIPFFVVLSYLDPDLYVQAAFYIIAVNNIAKEMIPGGKTWSSVQDFARFQHFLRKQKWRPSEVIPRDAKSDAVVKKIIRDATKLAELPNEPVSYPLPSFVL